MLGKSPLCILSYDERYREIWKKVSNIIKNELYSKLVYNEKYLKTKIKS